MGKTQSKGSCVGIFTRLFYKMYFFLFVCLFVLVSVVFFFQQILCKSQPRQNPAHFFCFLFFLTHTCRCFFKIHSMGSDLTLTKTPLFISTTAKPTCFTYYFSPISVFFPALPFLHHFFLFFLHQVPGQLHGRCQGGLHERKSSQRHAHHHPT